MQESGDDLELMYSDVSRRMTSSMLVAMFALPGSS